MKKLTAALSLAVILGAYLSQAALGLTYTVTRFDDPSPGACDPGDCSLREAILAANANPGPDTIILEQGEYRLEIPVRDENVGLTGDLDITEDLTIRGAGASKTIVDGGALDTVFHIHAANVTISDLTIKNGRWESASSGGGGITLGTNDVLDIGLLTLERSVLRDNVAVGGSSHGGGIRENGDYDVTIVDSVITGNLAVDLGDSAGGGIRVSGNTLTVIRSAVSQNVTAGGTSGGGLRGSGTTMMIVNSTISHNRVEDADCCSNGGGIRNSGGDTTLISSTVVFNELVGETGGDEDRAGGIRRFDPTAPLTLKDTIVAGNVGGRGDCDQPATTSDHSIDSDGSCGLTGTGDISDASVAALRLGPLQDNGGSTLTHALRTGSIAIDAGSLDCPPPATDQRGVERPQDGDGDGVAICDIGAYELEAISLTITKVCITGDGDGDADFNVLVTQLEDILAADALDCGEVMVVEGLSGIVTISELITGPDAGNFLTAIICTTAAGQTVTPGSLAQVNIEVDTACQIVNAFQDPDGGGEEPSEPGLPPGSVIVPIDIDNTNSNALNNENLNDNNNENTNTQEQSNEQEQTNDNNQTTTVNSSPSVVIDFD